MKIFKPLRDLVLVEKLEEEKNIVIPDQMASHFVRLKVLEIGPEVSSTIRGKVVWAENLLEGIKPGDTRYLILSKYIVCIEEEDGRPIN